MGFNSRETRCKRLIFCVDNSNRCKPIFPQPIADGFCLTGSPPEDGRFNTPRDASKGDGGDMLGFPDPPGVEAPVDPGVSPRTFRGEAEAT